MTLEDPAKNQTAALQTVQKEREQMAAMLKKAKKRLNRLEAKDIEKLPLVELTALRKQQQKYLAKVTEVEVSYFKALLSKHRRRSERKRRNLP